MIRVDLVGWALLLIAMAMSYSVLIKAAKTDNKSLKMMGYIIGVIILAAVLILAVSDLGSRARMKKGALVNPRRAAGTLPGRTNVNAPAIPRVPRTAVERTPAMPAIPAPPAAPAVQ